MFEKVAEVLAEYKDIDVSEVKPDSSFADLQVDSLDTVELVMDLEDQLGVSIELNESIKTVGDLVKLIESAQ